MSSIPENFIEELKQKTDIVSVISRYMELNKKGRQWWGLCPFHGEKTPSFAVSEEDQFYHCFGCKESGNAITFVMKQENCSFVDAIKILAEWAGLKVPEVDSKHDEEESKLKKQCLAALRDCAMYYYECLLSPQGEAARKYLADRGVNDKLAKLFGLGYCPDFDKTKKVLNQKGYSDKVLLEAGILKNGEHGLYDPMGTRIVYPIINAYSEVVAFSGRTMKPKVDFAKYLNTAETKVYSKGKTLYALNLVKKYQKNGQKFDYFILCEGNMDVISLHKAGFGMAVAGMGTALTFDQAKLIKRFVNKVYICYDGDTAGKKATLRGLDILKNQGLDVLVMSLPNGKDPDDVIQSGGRSAFESLIEKALPLVEYRIRTLAVDYDLSSFDGKSKFTSAALEVLKELKSDVERETYLPLVQDISGTNRDFLRRQMSQAPVAVVEEEKPKTQTETNDFIVLSKAEKIILSLAYHKNCTNEFEKAKAEISYFDDLLTAAAKNIYTDIQNGVLASELCEKYVDYASDIGEIVITTIDENDKAKNEFWDCVRVLKNNYLQEKQDSLNKAIAMEPEREKRQQLLKELEKITKERNLNKK